MEASPGTGVSCWPAASARWPVQPGQEVLPGQLRRRHPGQQLPGPEPAVALLDRPDRLIQRLDHAEPAAQLGDRRQARVRRQRRIRRADPRLLTLHPPAAYPAHQIGVLSAEMIIHFAAIIIPGQSGTYRHLRGRVTDLLADSGLSSDHDPGGLQQAWPALLAVT